MKPDDPVHFSKIRSDAEMRLQDQVPATCLQPSVAETQRLIHELQVHQIELEMQNEELRNSQAKVEEQKERYADFYDFSPLGFVSLARTGTINQINLAGAQLLGKARSQLTGKSFESFVVMADRPSFRACLQLVFATPSKQSWQVVLRGEGRSPRVVRIEAALASDGQECCAVLVDITAQQQYQQALLASQALAKATVDAVSEQIAVLDKTGTIFTVNKAWCDFCDKNPPQASETSQPDYYIGTNYLDICEAAVGLDSGESVQMAQGLRNVMRGAQDEFVMEYPCHSPNEQRWFVARVTRFHDGSGHVVVSHDNISERKRAEAQLQVSHDLLAKLSRQVPGMFYQFRQFPDGRSCFPYTSEGIREVYGVTPDEVFADAAVVFSVVHPDDLDEVVASIQESARTLQPWLLDYRVKLPQKGVRWLSGFAKPEQLQDGSILWHGYISDITAKREIQDTLQESEKKFRAQSQRLSEVIWGTNIGTWEWNVKTGEEVFNSRFAEMVGYTLDELTPSSIATWNKLAHPDDLKRSYELLQRYFNRELEYFKCEVRMRHKNGDWVWVLDRGRVVEWSIDGKPLRMSGTHQDITMRKVAEATLAKYMAALQVAKGEAEQANHAKSHFLAAASHDLRQPLAALSLYVEVLKIKMNPPDDKLLTNMTSCVSSLSELLTDLLDISKLEAGVVTPEMSNFSVSDLLEKLIAVHAPVAALKGLRLRWLPTFLHAHTDRVLLASILGNLIDNAIRYTQRGGVLVACRQYQGKTWIEVWDSGIGIAQGKIGEIFEEYRQLERDESSCGCESWHGRGHGSGLGLAIVAKSAALLGLHIRVKSRLGRGSMFAVELPLGKATGMAVPRHVNHNALRIALVDDNAILLDALGSILQGRGNQVVAAGSGPALLALLGSDPPDVLISDYRLGGGETGFDVIAAVRKVFGENLPALLITGDTDPKLMRSMTRQGIAVQHKPLKLDALMVTIAQVMKRRVL